MATTFSVLYLGIGPPIDQFEGDAFADNADAIFGTYGNASNPLSAEQRVWSPVGSPGLDYETDNTIGNDQFDVDGTVYTYDAGAVYSATVTYADGTNDTATVIVAQATTGELFVVPHIAGNESFQAVLEAAPIESITLNGIVGDTGNLQADRLDAAYPDGVVDGTTGDDDLGFGDSDANGDAIDDDGNVIDASSGADTIDGAGGDDTIIGGSGDDSLIGGTGNDSIDGGSDDDDIDGGIGNDTILGGSGSDTILGGTGNDSISGGSNQDDIDGGIGNDTISGGSGADTIAGGTGNDSIDGDTNNDSIDGGIGNDTLDGGVGSDTVRGGEGNDLVRGGGSTGNADTVYGGEGNDTVYGGDGAGADSLFGDEGDDLINGNRGDDTIFGGTGSDTIQLGDSFGDDVIDGGSDAGNGDVDVLDASDITTGGVTVDMNGPEDGTITDGFGTASFDEIEAFTLTDQDDMFDGDLANGDFTVDAGAGDDTLREGVGTNTFDGGDDADLFIAGYGTSTISGGEGGNDADTLSFAEADDTVDITLSDNEEGTYSDDDGDGGSFSEIEAFELTGGSDTFDGSAASSNGASVDGGDGDDSLTGTDADDSVVGGSGADTLRGRAGDDSLEGGIGDDVLDGGIDDDTLVGGTGDDSLTGGDGDDVFVYTSGLDTISDFNTGNSGALNDGDSTNNDFVDLSSYYARLSDLRADFLDDGILNQSNASDRSGDVDYSGQSRFASDEGIEFQTASSDGRFLTSDNTGVMCFTRGVEIATSQGLRPIEQLQVGDLVITRDNGLQSILWIGTRTLDHADLMAAPELRPIHVKAGLLGLQQDMIVSPQHGMLIRSKDRGTDEKLVRAKHLADIKGGAARVMRGARSVTYIHLLFASHQIIWANGGWAESLYPGPMALQNMSHEGLRELHQLFPELFSGRIETVYGHGARGFLRRKELPDHLNALIE